MVISRFSHLMSWYLTLFTIQTVKHIGKEIQPWHKIGQGQFKDTIYMNLVEFESQMLHAKLIIIGRFVLQNKFF